MIETERLIIRKFTMDDLPKLIELRSDPEVYKYIGGLEMQNPDAIEKRLHYYIDCWDQHGFGLCAMHWKETGEMIGWSGLQPLEETGETEVSYGMAKDFWGKGIGTQCARVWLDYGFTHCGLDRIVAVAIPENQNSWRIMEKLGMRFEKLEKHYGSDCKFYAISKDEFLKSKKI